MTVICINDKWDAELKVAHLPNPKIGDKDIVINTMKKNGAIFYCLENFPGTGFLSTHFVTLPDQTDDELQEATKEAIVNLQTA